MSGSRILFFLLAVYALLAGICLVFPEGGLSLAGTTLTFPSIGEVKSSLLPARSSATEPSPEELLTQRHEALRRAEQQRFEEFFTSNPARIHFPGGDERLLDPFFSALDSAGKHRLRILHYGDSQIEEDRISGTLRAGLQERFGGSGPGLLPLSGTYFNLGTSLSCSATLNKYIVFGEGERRKDGLYGVMGQCAVLDTAISVSVLPLKSNTTPSSRFCRLSLLTGASGKVNLKYGSRTYNAAPANPGQSIRRICIDLPDSSSRVRFTLWGSADIYGVQLDDSLGVCLDNIPMRGCSGTELARISASQLGEYAQTDNVRLIILQFGGNPVPYRTSAKSISEYASAIEDQIRRLKALAPDAAVLFIGPSDMCTSVRGKMQTYPSLPMIVDSLKVAANNAGAAYWDMFQAMGGEGSMAQWVKASPALAGSDYVHFTTRGAEEIGNMLLETVMLYYDWYKLRQNGNE